MLKGKDYSAEDAVFPSLEAYNDPTIGFQNEAKMAGVHCMYVQMVLEVVLQNYSRVGFVAELDKLCKEI